MGTQLPQKKGTLQLPTHFLAYVYCGQTAGWMETLLGTEVDLGPCHIVLDGVPLPREGHSSPRLFSAHVYCGHGRPSQLLLSSCTNGRPKTVCHMLSDRCPVLSVCDVGVLWPNGWMDQDETWQADRPRPWPHCVRWGPSCPSPKGHRTAKQ